MPPWLTLAVWLLLTADSFFTVRLLLQYHDIDLLGWKNLLRRRAAALCDAVRADDMDTFLKLIVEGGHSSFEFNQNAYSIKNYKEQGVPIALALSQKVLNGRGALASAGWRLRRHHPGVCAL